MTRSHPKGRKRRTKGLIPPDTKRCQTIHGGAFRLGPPTRCYAKPLYIATERRPGADGRKGSMSLCESCRDALVRDLGPDYCTFRKLP